MRRRGQWVVVWEFRVRRGREREFERRYGPRGDWARLFRRGRGYVRTELLRDREARGRYLTVDVWTSPGAYAAFRKRWREEYAAIDARCEALTRSERLVGHFQLI